MNFSQCRDPDRTSVVERLGEALRECCELDVVVEEEALLQREMVPRAWAQRVRGTMSRYPTLDALEVLPFTKPCIGCAVRLSLRRLCDSHGVLTVTV